MEVTVVGHGSLMSGRGLLFSGTLQVKDAFIVALKRCRRGFAKLSRYGDRFATDIEVQHFPLEGERVPLATSPSGDVETLALTVPLEDFLRLVKREGYRPDAMQRLVELAVAQKQPLAEFLCRLQTDVGDDVVAYRRQLFSLTGYTSPHYIPHPVRLTGDGAGLIFLAPGFEGTGAEEVVSVRQQTGIQEVMSICEAWRRKPNDDQVAYFLSCLLGGVHGVSVHDLLTSVSEEPGLVQLLQKRLLQELPDEMERFLAATSLPESIYRHTFGDHDARGRRSGLSTFLLSAQPKG